MAERPAVRSPIKGIVLGVIIGLVVAFCTSKPIYDLIWDSDEGGSSGFFAFLIVMPLFATLGGAIGGGVRGNWGLLRIVGCLLGIIMSTGTAVLIVAKFLSQLHPSPIQAGLFILGGAVVGGVVGYQITSKLLARLDTK
ncbi:MAG TPA: hypothetical protein VMV72_15955 [Verrucomicrobiae bacterium]|nr:hypothetical protein [Verrucomicrobiae bacterium]